MRHGNIQIQSENMMPIIKKWLYSDKDIFLREIVANSCDAVSKLQKLVSIGEASDDGAKPRIVITLDKAAKTIRVEDNGIGMTEDEVERYITQVAFSGAQEFLERYKDESGPDTGIIGHFGLGFYSAFMVSDSVEIETLSYLPEAKPVHWASSGESTYEIGEGTRGQRGTTVTLHISEAESEFLEERRIREVLRRYCAFMPVEIYLNPKESSVIGIDAANVAENAEGQPEETQVEKAAEQPVNNTSPLWLKAPRDCTDEEYKRFYTELFMDFSPPLFWIHLNVDYPFNLKGILYFPRQSNKLEVMPGEVKLYSNQVYIADNIKEVIPEYLMLLKGVIDCPDLPLNVSRSFLQNDSDVQKISRHITKKVSDKLHSIFTDDRKAFEGYWEDISPFIKYGCMKDEGFYDRVKDILLLRSIDGSYLTLDEFPRDSEHRIFYATDEKLQSQYIRMFREQGQQAAVLGHAIDLHFINFLEYKNPKTRFARIDSELGESAKADNGEAAGEEIIEIFKQELDNKDLIIKAETLRSQQTPAVILLSETSRRMQEMSQYFGDAFKDQKPEITLMLNLGNDIVRSIPTLAQENRKLFCEYITDLAILGHRQLTSDEMAAFIDRSAKVLALASGAPGQPPADEPHP